MAKLSTAYGLCSLTEQGGFVHVFEDTDGCAVVTLGKNISIRYRLVDQKQLNSWSTIQPFSTPVVFNPVTSEYLAVVNDTILKRWKDTDSNLEKVPKIKLKDVADSVLLEEEPIVLFRSGACARLSYVEDKNHSPVKGFLNEAAKIKAACIITENDQKYLAVIEGSNLEATECHCVRLTGHALQPDLKTLTTYKIRRKSHKQNKLLASCFFKRDSSTSILTLWSDGFIYSLSLPDSKVKPPGNFVGVVRCIAGSTPAAVTQISPNHVAIYGADPSEEGAVLAVYNLHYGIVQASTTFKILHSPPRVWAFHNRLLVGFGQRLLCVPFDLQTNKLSALVGTRRVVSEATSDIVAVVPSVSWEGKEKKQVEAGKPSKALENKDIEELVSQGLSESGICDALINDYVSKTDVDKLLWCLDNLVDIPENLTVLLLKFAFSTPDEKFSVEVRSSKENPVVNGGSPKSPKKKRKSVSNKLNHVNGVCETITAELPILSGAMETMETCPVRPAGRAEFLDRVLNVPCNKATLVTALRTGFNTTDCLNILQYLNYQLTSGKHGKNTIDWLNCVIDAFYQQLLLGKNSECVESVLRLRDSISHQIAAMNDLKDLLPVVAQLRRSKGAKNPVQLKSYSIQKIHIYD